MDNRRLLRGDRSIPVVSPLDLYLEFCTRTDPRYQQIRLNHYVPNRGTHGQQLHFLIFYQNKLVGIMSSGSAVYSTARRDQYFGFTKENRESSLNGLVDNILFRLEYHEANLATRCMALWRRSTAHLWEDLYNVKVYGFETFVDDVREGHDTLRNGGLYLADNWQCVGRTDGNTKHHGKEGLTGGIYGSPFKRRIVPKKLIFCRWADLAVPQIIPFLPVYKSSWRNQTPEEKVRSREIANKRIKYLGSKLFMCGKKLILEIKDNGSRTN